MDRPSINQALTLGHSRLTNSIIPSMFEFYWPPPAPVHSAARAKALLAEAGHPNGFDAGDFYCDGSYGNLAEAVLNNLQAVGIRAKLRPLERAAFFSGYSDKKFQGGLVQASSGAFGNTATRLGGLRGHRGRLRVRDSSRPRRALPGSRPRSWTASAARPCCTRSSSSFTSAWSTPPSGSWLPQRRGARVGESGLRPHPRPRLLGALRGRDAQGEVRHR